MTASEPLVACVMLTCNRPQMARRAIECFRRQTYDPTRRLLLILDTGDTSWYDPRSDAENEVHIASPGEQRSIGALRNTANAMIPRAQVFAHWDDDDWSHPSRLEEQVAFLKASGAGVVAYNDMLFWKTERGPNLDAECECGNRYTLHMHTVCPECAAWPNPMGEAWLYRSPNPQQMVGTSLLYWRDVWNRVPFGPEHEGEDAVWVLKLASARVKTAACSSIPMDYETAARLAFPDGPRMIASIHGNNTSSQITPGVPEWARAAEWDRFAKETMVL